MANIFKPEPITYGDYNAWGPKELAQNEPMTGVLTSKLYLDGLALKLSVGSIGLNNGSSIGICKIDTVTTISLAGLTISEWAKVEMSVVGTTVVLAITSMGITTPHILPTAFTGAFDGAKGAYHIVATKRCLGIVFINAAGACAGIINPMSFIDAYDGYSTSNDGLAFYYYFSKNVQSSKPVKVQKAFILDTTLPDLQEDTELVASLMGGRRATLPTLADNIGRVITLWKLEDNQWWSEVAGEGAETINGDNIYYLRRVHDYITVVGETTGWHIIANGAPKIVELGWTNATDFLNQHLGCAVALTAAANFLVGDKIVGTTSANYGWIIGKSGNTVYLRDHTDTSTTGWANGETITRWTVDGATATTTTTTAASRNVDADFYHGLNSTLPKIKFTLLLCIAVAVAEASMVYNLTGVGDGGDVTFDSSGVSLYAATVNQATIQTGTDGWTYVKSDGTIGKTAAQDWFFNIIAEVK